MGLRCFIALGANLGNPIEMVQTALEALRGLPETDFVAASSLYQTAPVGLHHQPDFINAVAEVNTTLSASALLQALFAIEERFGRQRSVKNAPRTLDLDLLLYGEMTSHAPELELPHPRMHERAFVLAPLAELRPDLMIAGHGAVGDLLARCANQKLKKLNAVCVS